MAEQEPPRAFDRERTAKDAERAFSAWVDRVNLRKWCVEQAKGNVQEARAIFDFCCEDLAGWFAKAIADDAR